MALSPVGSSPWRRRVALAVLSLSLPPGLPGAVSGPLTEGVSEGLTGPLAASWTARSTDVTAVVVRLNGLGARTHANWVLYRLPFSTTQTNRIRSVRFTPGVRRPSDVGALRIGSVCIEVPSSGGIDNWSSYTVSGVGYTERYRWHVAPPTDDPTILGLNVPTRVANFVACGGDDALRAPETWTLHIEWEER
jgi:hypothetical protein